MDLNRETHSHIPSPQYAENNFVFDKVSSQRIKFVENNQT